MSLVMVRILAQYEENYGLAEGGADCWKNKGGAEFTFEIDSHLMFYDSEKVINTVKTVLLKEKSNRFCRYSYLSHELVFDQPISIQQEMEKALGEG